MYNLQINLFLQEIYFKIIEQDLDVENNIYLIITKTIQNLM